MNITLQFLLLWLASIIISKVMDLSLGFKMVKDIADLGYKINKDRITNLANQLGVEQLKKSKIESFIPIYNIFKSMYINAQYINYKEQMISSLNALSIIDEMTDLEKDVYNEKPGAIRAIALDPIVQFELDSSIKIEVSKDNLKGIIYFEKKYNLIRVLKSEGVFEKIKYGTNCSYNDFINQIATILSLYKTSINEIKITRGNIVKEEDDLKDFVSFKKVGDEVKILKSDGKLKEINDSSYDEFQDKMHSYLIDNESNIYCVDITTDDENQKLDINEDLSLENNNKSRIEDLKKLKSEISHGKEDGISKQKRL